MHQRPTEILNHGTQPMPHAKEHRMWEPLSLADMDADLTGFQLERLIGCGGMGAVYLAVERALDRLVAIKVLPRNLMDAAESSFVERFVQEAQTMARLNHPGIVRVFDSGRTACGMSYFVMEYVDGTDLSLVLLEGALPPERLLDLAEQLCRALGAAHAEGITHRDIKPSNLLLTKGGELKIADFGLAKHQDTEALGLTRSSVAIGTPDYLAPEAWTPGTVLDSRADLFAVGVVLYQMLTGQIPRGLWNPASEVAGTDPRFDAIVDKAMQPDRNQRYASASQILADLATIRSTPPPAITSPPKRAGLRWVFAGAGLAGAAVATVVLLPTQGPASHPRLPTRVTTLADDGPGSLRQAMENCDQNPGPDTVTFAPDLAGKTISLTARSPRLATITARNNSNTTTVIDPLTIDASGLPGGVILSVRQGFFFWPGDSVTITGVTFTGCQEQNSNFGHLTLTDCTLTGNTSKSGGGAFYNLNSGRLEMVHCHLTNNNANANGGAVQNLGTLVLTDCDFKGNKAHGSGGAIAHDDGSLTMTNCTFSENEAKVQGGAMAVVQGSVSATNCTFVHNTVVGETAPIHGGGGIYLAESTNVRLTSCLVAENRVASGTGPEIWNQSGTLALLHSFLGNNLDSSSNNSEGSTIGTPTVPLTLKDAPADVGAP